MPAKSSSTDQRHLELIAIRLAMLLLLACLARVLPLNAPPAPVDATMRHAAVSRTVDTGTLHDMMMHD